MRPARRLLVLAIVALAGLTVPVSALAATTEDLVALATGTYGMTCTVGTGEVTCAREPRIGPRWDARITPETGPETELVTAARVGQAPLDVGSIEWLAAMHAAACGAANGVNNFVSRVGALTTGGQLGPEVIGACRFNGGYNGGTLAAPIYTVSSVVLPPTPPATSSPTAQPTPQPTPKATATPGPTPAPTLPPTQASAAPTATPVATPSPSLAPSEAPGGSATATPAPAPTNQATAPAPAEGDAPVPTEPPDGNGGAGGAGGGPLATSSPFFQSVASAVDIRSDGEALIGSALTALLMLLLIGFAAELFNNTIENNYDEIAGWFRSRRLGWLGQANAWLARHTRLSVLGFVALTALVSAFIDPGFGANLASVATFLGFLVGLVVVLASFKLPLMLAHRRATGELGRLRPLPWALVIAVVFVVISRVGELQPGYLYGIVLGAIFTTDVSDADEGRHTLYGSLWTLAAAVLAWLALEWLRGQGPDEAAFAVTLAETAFAAILVAGLEATAFGLMPLRFMPGFAIYRWNRLAWAALFGASLFAFVHILIGPTSGYVSELAPEAWVAALGVFAAFGALSIVTWGYFRFRPMPAQA